MLTIFQSIWCWPTGLIQVLLYIPVFYESKLYSDMVLHLIYAFMNIYGWYYWIYGTKDSETLKIVSLPLNFLFLYIFLTLSGAGVWGFIMTSYTDAAMPYLDAFIVTASLVAQWLLARKNLVSWYFWISVDIVAIFVYAAKELYPTAILYTVFLVLAFSGLRTWSKEYRDSTSLLLA